MAAKGAILKQEIAKQILDAFPGSFLYNDGKEIRINGIENGENLQIKLVMTAAKTPVDGGDGSAVASSQTGTTAAPAEEKIPQEPTDEEKERLCMLLNKLGL